MKAVPKVLPIPAKIEKPAAADIDRLGVLRARIKANGVLMAPDVAEEKRLTEKLQEHEFFTAAPADTPVTAEGELYLLQLGMRQEEQKVINGGWWKIYKWLGPKVFVQFAKITFEVLKASLTAEQYKQVVKKERTGRRSFEVVAKAEPQKAA